MRRGATAKSAEDRIERLPCVRADSLESWFFGESQRGSVRVGSTCDGPAVVQCAAQHHVGEVLVPGGPTLEKETSEREREYLDLCQSGASEDCRCPSGSRADQASQKK